MVSIGELEVSLPVQTLALDTNKSEIYSYIGTDNNGEYRYNLQIGVESGCRISIKILPLKSNHSDGIIKTFIREAIKVGSQPGPVAFPAPSIVPIGPMGYPMSNMPIRPPVLRQQSMPKPKKKTPQKRKLSTASSVSSGDGSTGPSVAPISETPIEEGIHIKTDSSLDDAGPEREDTRGILFQDEQQSFDSDKQDDGIDEHGNTQLPTNYQKRSAQPMKCPYCDKHFKNRPSCSTHMYSMHTELHKKAKLQPEKIDEEMDETMMTTNEMPMPEWSTPPRKTAPPVSGMKVESEMPILEMIGLEENNDTHAAPDAYQVSIKQDVLERVVNKRNAYSPVKCPYCWCENKNKNTCFTHIYMKHADMHKEYKRKPIDVLPLPENQ